MNRLLRLLTYIRDRLPLYSWNRCCEEWFKGQDYARRELGVTRDARGRFTSAPKEKPAAR